MLAHSKDASKLNEILKGQLGNISAVGEDFNNRADEDRHETDHINELVTPRGED